MYTVLPYGYALIHRNSTLHQVLHPGMLITHPTNLIVEANRQFWDIVDPSRYDLTAQERAYSYQLRKSCDRPNPRN